MDTCRNESSMRAFSGWRLEYENHSYVFPKLICKAHIKQKTLKRNSPTKFYLLVLAVLTFVSCLGSSQGEKVAKSTGPVVEGEVFPVLRFENKSGEIIELTQSEAKVRVVNFWATWCAPCLAEMPALQKLQNKLGPKGLEIVAVSVDSKKDFQEVQKVIDQNSLSFQVLYDPEFSSPSKLGITGFPETFFLSSEGKVLKIRNPETGLETVKLISDQPWDSEPFLNELERLLLRAN